MTSLLTEIASPDGHKVTGMFTLYSIIIMLLLYHLEKEQLSNLKNSFFSFAV